MTELVLASSSHARAGMLRNAGLDIEVHPARIDEETIKISMRAENAPARDIADTLAEMKATQISAKHQDMLVLGADQVLVHNGKLCSKATSREEAAEQLLSLRGDRHDLLSAAVIVRNGEPIWRHIGKASLHVRPFSDAFLESYLNAACPDILDAVGGYHLEGLGAQLFSRVEGDYFTVLGLPLLELLGFLRARGVLVE